MADGQVDPILAPARYATVWATQLHGHTLTTLPTDPRERSLGANMAFGSHFISGEIQQDTTDGRLSLVLRLGQVSVEQSLEVVQHPELAQQVVNILHDMAAALHFHPPGERCHMSGPVLFDPAAVSVARN